MTAARRLWSHTVRDEATGLRVTVHERAAGGVLYERVWDPAGRRTVRGRVYVGQQRRRSLGHRDKTLAQEQALDELRLLVSGRQLLTPLPRIGNVLSLYLVHRTPHKRSAQHRAEDARRVRLWRTWLGDARRVDSIGEADWHAFIAQRSSGAISAQGVPVEASARVPVGARTVDADLVFLLSVFNWACGFKLEGKPLLRENPWGTRPGVKRALQRPVNPQPHRPLITWDEFVRLREAAVQVTLRANRGEPGAWLVTVQDAVPLGRSAAPTPGPVKHWRKPGYLHELLDLCEQTGRRIGEVARLHHDDLVREDGVLAGIRWRPHKHGRRARVVPVSDETRATLEQIVRRRPGVGHTPLFPSPADPARPVSKRTCHQWLERAKALAGLGDVAFGFHALRRKWATERKGHARRDVMWAAGWEDERAFTESYEQPDQDTVLAVVREPRKLRRKVSG